MVVFLFCIYYKKTRYVRRGSGSGLYFDRERIKIQVRVCDGIFERVRV